MRRYAFVRVLFASLFVAVAHNAFATTDAVNATSVSPTLQVSVTVQKTVRLTLSTGTSGTTCNVTAASDYSMNFGNVDALGINTPCGSMFAPTTPGSTAAVYYTDYRLTPTFTNQTSTSATVTAYVSSNFATLNNVLSIVQSNSSPGSIGALTAMSTASGSPTSIGPSLASGTAITRYVGVSILPTNSGSATVSGTDSATITYTMTVP
jgi:hypothetical protein